MFAVKLKLREERKKEESCVLPTLKSERPVGFGGFGFVGPTVLLSITYTRGNL